MHHPGEPLPENAGDDLFVAKAVNLKCPLSLETLVNPMKNPACGHSYSKDEVESYMQRRLALGEQPRCPKFGCEAILADLERDIEAERAVAKASKQPKKRARSKVQLDIE